MMRSLFSGVAGLRTHQTRMDVIGNNIANVNTVAYKSNSVTFQDLLYQTTQSASGANAATGRAGINAKQIGLGVSTGSISTNISTSGSAQNTGSPFDIRITGDSFFVVSDGSNNYYTRAGAFNVDANGTLAMATNGYTVMGYGTTKDTNDNIVINTSSLTSLDIMSDENMISDPIATTNGYIAGILDKNSDALATTAGQAMAIPFYDNLGYSYTAQFKIEKANGAAGADDGLYRLSMTDIIDADGESIFKESNSKGEMVEMSTAKKMSILNSSNILSMGGVASATSVAYLAFDTYETPSGEKPSGQLLAISFPEDKTKLQSAESLADVTENGGTLLYSETTGTGDNAKTTYYYTTANKTLAETLKDPAKRQVAKSSENGSEMLGLTLNLDALVGRNDFAGAPAGFRGMKDDQTNNLKGVAVDFSQMQNIDNKGSSTVTGKRGQLDSDAGAGCAAGEMSSISIGMDGKITAAYTNGQTKLLGQIATATFANASGLEKTGDNLYSTTLNSGEAVINDITANGGSMSTGELEMSNVDLSDEFTTMITTQRGFQANSRIITVSDSMLEELVNLKR